MWAPWYYYLVQLGQELALTYAAYVSFLFWFFLVQPGEFTYNVLQEKVAEEKILEKQIIQKLSATRIESIHAHAINRVYIYNFYFIL